MDHRKYCFDFVLSVFNFGLLLIVCDCHHTDDAKLHRKPFTMTQLGITKGA